MKTNNRGKGLFTCLIAVWLVLLSSWGEEFVVNATDAEDGIVYAESIELTIQSKEDNNEQEIAPILPADGEVLLMASVLPEGAMDDVTWESSNEYLAKVENGRVIGQQSGVGQKVTITAIANDGSGVSGSIDLWITPILVRGIKVQPTEDYQLETPNEVAVGSLFQLEAIFTPANATVQDVIWECDKPEYAIVYQTGYVKVARDALGQTVIIRATSDGGAGENDVYGEYVLYIGMRKDAVSEESDQDSNTNESTESSDGENTNSSTNSGNTENTGGTTEAGNNNNTNGSTESGNNGNANDSAISGDTSVKVTSIQIKGKATAVKAGKKLKLKASVSPSNAANTVVTWSSNNEKYATVDADGVVKTKKAGLGKTVIITAEAQDGSGIKATYNIKIVKATVTKIKITASSKTVQAGGKVTLKATVKPKNVTTKKVKWSSSNKKYATVNAKGVVKTKKAGKGKMVTITAKAKDGSGKKAAIKIKIK